jgi:hypothetical protein
MARANSVKTLAAKRQAKQQEAEKQQRMAAKIGEHHFHKAFQRYPSIRKRSNFVSSCS